MKINNVLKSFQRKLAAPTTMSAPTITSKMPTAAFSTITQQQRPWEESKVLLTGCQGQIGVPLARAICKELGSENVVASDVGAQKFDFPCQFEKLDVTDGDRYMKMVKKHKVTYIVHLAGILSALGERNPDLAVDVNVLGMINAMRAAQATESQIFVPSSIAAFGGDKFPKVNTPVDVILQPKTIYGVGKVFNEMMGGYWAKKFNIDFRSIRYPGVISSEKYAFNGTTDYSTEIFFHMLENGHYTCWLAEETALPMIYIDDCIEATLQYLRADRARLQRTCYNLAGISFSAGDFCRDVQKLIPGATLDF